MLPEGAQSGRPVMHVLAVVESVHCSVAEAVPLFWRFMIEKSA
jgi:hypothetical protein